MIVIGVDVHKHSLPAVAVDELGRTLAEHNGPVDEQVAAWARSLDGATGERTDLPRGESHAPIRSRSTVSGRRRRHNAGKSAPTDSPEWSQPPPTRVSATHRTPPSPDNDSEFRNDAWAVPRRHRSGSIGS